MIFTKCSHAIANHISPDAAWVFGVIEYWSTANARKKNPKSLKNGLYCMFMSLPAFQKELPFIKRSALQTALQTLRDHGIVASFEGDANSNRAKYYTVDQEGWLKFQVWSSGYILSARDGRALTPIDEQVPDAEPEISYPVAPQQIDDPILLPHNRYPVAHQQHILLPANRMPHTLDIKSSYKEFKEIKVCDVGHTDHTPRPKKPKDASEGSLIFKAYSEAYAKRYGQDPLRNAKVNSVCSQIAKQVGVEVGQAVMHFYIEQNVSWYVQKAHAIEYALKDLQALRTNMLNNQAMSSRQAQLVDKQQSQKNALDNYLANREKYAFK